MRSASPTSLPFCVDINAYSGSRHDVYDEDDGCLTNDPLSGFQAQLDVDVVGAPTTLPIDALILIPFLVY